MNHTRRCFWLCLALMVLQIGGISATHAEPAGSKILKLGVRSDAPPFSYKDPHTDNFKGFSVDLCRRIGTRAKRELGYDDVTLLPLNSQERFERLENMEVDILCGASTVTLERLKSASASLYTFLSGASFMYARPVGTDKDKPLRIGVLQKTTTKEHFEATIWPKLKKDLKKVGFRFSGLDEPKEVESHWQSLAFFQENKIDIYIADREILLALKKSFDAENLVVSNRYYTIEPYALFIRRDDAALQYIVNRTLRDLYLEDNRADNIRIILQKNFPGQIFSDTLLNLYRIQRILD